MKFDRLRAKSGDGSCLSEFLPNHLADVHRAAERVLAATAADQLSALGLDITAYRDRLSRCVLLAAAVHDLGKANDHFQGMLWRDPARHHKQQGLRHEWVTILMLKQLREWLLPAVGGSIVDMAIVEWAVAGHHPGPTHASPPRSSPAGAGADIQLLAGHADFTASLAWLKATFLLPDASPMLSTANRTLVGGGNVFAELASWAKTASRCWNTLLPSDRRFVAAVKDCLVAADVSGSALPRRLSNDANCFEWITDSFAAKPTASELNQIVEHRLKSATPRAFQIAVAASAAPVTFVKAGCGSGKTLAAYLWAATNHVGRRLFFCYPTTGTATEGFRDYLFEPDVRADLFHSRRDIDFEIILTTGADTEDVGRDEALRMESLDAWSTPIVACTVDNVLGIVQNNKRGLFAWPALAQSAFIFDEIHAYDDRLFGALLRFLRDLPGLPKLLMTASLPLARQEALRETVRQTHGFDLAPIPGPRESEELPRYRKAAVAMNDPMPLIERTLADRGKVLWVCNTVGRVMEASDRAKAYNPKIYHSRFRYEDRVRRHEDVIRAFDRDNHESALAICSQVAEMSLDLSCDLLVTDLATVPALIQRLGRLNRRAEKGDATKPFIVVEPDSHLPYTPADIDAARAWLASLPDDEISQSSLVKHWEQSADNPPDLVPSAWLDGGPTTTVTELRETAPGINVIWHGDQERVLANPRDISRVAIPMPSPPRSLNWNTWRKERGIPFAPSGAILYDQKRGAEWIK